MEVNVRNLSAATRENIRLGRLGKKASPATIEKLKVINSRPRGSYKQKWSRITTLCIRNGATFTRTQGRWICTDREGHTHAYTSADELIQYLETLDKRVEDLTAQIKELCDQTGYSSKTIGKQWYVYDQYKMRIFDSDSPRSIISFITHMRDWMRKEGLLKKPTH